jgi:outer membrane protein
MLCSTALAGQGILKELSTRMKRLLALAALLASGFALNASAQTSAAPAASAPVAKIAVIAFQVAVAQTNEGQRDFADLEKKFQPKRDQLKSLSDEIDNLKKQLQDQSATLSQDERTSRTHIIDEKQRDLQRSAQDAQTDFQQELQDMYNGLASKVYDVMAAYAKQHGYTLILDVAQQQNPVLYAAESTNITKEVIAAYNTKSGVPAPPAAAPASGASGEPDAPAPAPKNQ